MARLSPQNVALAHEIIGRYPQRRSALIPLLHVAQGQDGHVTDDAMIHVAELVDVTPAEVRGVATFYEMFKEHPVGRYLIGVCTNLSCMLLGADELLRHLERTLGMPAGATSADGTFTLEEMQCLAACGGAPCLQVNYRYFENVTPEAADAILDDLRAGRDPMGQSVPPHGTLSRVVLPSPVTPVDRVEPEELHEPEEAS